MKKAKTKTRRKLCALTSAYRFYSQKWKVAEIEGVFNYSSEGEGIMEILNWAILIIKE